MNIQSHFNEKKQFFASFFMQLEQLIRELSIAIQLEIDREYFCAKQLLCQQSATVIAEQCIKMRARHPQMLRKMIDIVCSNAIAMSESKNEQNSCLNIPMSLQKSQATQQTIQYTNMKNKVEQNAKNKNKIAQFQPLNQIRIASSLQTEINQQPLQPFNRANTHYAQYRRNMSLSTTPLIKNSQPVQLLNKINKKSSKSIHKVSNFNQAFPNETQQILKSINDRSNYSQVNKIIMRSDQKDHINILSPNHRNPYNPENKKLINKQLFAQVRNQQQANKNEMKSKMEEQLFGSSNKYRYIEDNHTICQALDQRIHEEALQILYKVKSKRSPHRQKQAKDYKHNQSVKMKSNTSLLNISNDPLSIRRFNRISSPKKTN